jgi:hypothetical protein
MPIEITEEDKRRLSPEDLENLREALADFEAQAADPKDPQGMPRDKTDFPIGIYILNPKLSPTTTIL